MQEWLLGPAAVDSARRINPHLGYRSDLRATAARLCVYYVESRAVHSAFPAGGVGILSLSEFRLCSSPWRSQGQFPTRLGWFSSSSLTGDLLRSSDSLA